MFTYFTYLNMLPPPMKERRSPLVFTIQFCPQLHFSIASSCYSCFSYLLSILSEVHYSAFQFFVSLQDSKLAITS